MKKNYLFLILALFMIILIISCDLNGEKQPKSTEPVYKALTPEAQAILDKLQAGKDPGRILYGGMTEERAIALNAEKFGIQYDSKGIPTTKPNSPQTRPKITLVTKLYGPGESVSFNNEDGSKYGYPTSIALCQKPYYITSLSVKTWRNKNYTPDDDYFYTSIICQRDDYISGRWEYHTPDSAAGKAGWNSWYKHLQNIETWDTDATKVLEGGVPKTIYGGYFFTELFPWGNPGNETIYIYMNVPTAAFENQSSGPLSDTWYWNPPWHFETVNKHMDRWGNWYYDAITKPGFEDQGFVYGYYYTDFIWLYSGNGNPDALYNYGWRIKDIDVENGIVTAFLTRGTYSEIYVIYLPDDQAWNFIEGVHPLGYRSLVIDSSW